MNGMKTVITSIILITYRGYLLTRKWNIVHSYTVLEKNSRQKIARTPNINHEVLLKSLPYSFFKTQIVYTVDEIRIIAEKLPKIQDAISSLTKTLLSSR